VPEYQHVQVGKSVGAPAFPALCRAGLVHHAEPQPAEFDPSHVGQSGPELGPIVVAVDAEKGEPSGHDLQQQFVQEVGGWIRDGKLHYEETVVDGIENNVEAFLGMLRGDNTGKMIVTLPAQAAVGN
jgi:hypothetical protein